MLLLLMVNTAILGLVLVFLYLNQMLSSISKPSHSESHPYECGYDTSLVSSPPFSSRFFMIALVFIIFDVEIILIFPLLLTHTKPLPSWVILKISLLSFLILSTMMEWAVGTLEWIYWS